MTLFIILIFCIVLFVGVLVPLVRYLSRKSISKRCDWTCPKCNCEIEKWMEDGSPPEHCRSCRYDLRAHRSSLRVRLWRRCVPELDLFPPHESDRAFRRAAWNWQTNLSITAMGIVGFVIGLCVPPILHSMFPLHHLILGLIRHSSLFGFILWGMWLSRTRIRRKLRQELIDAGFALCGPCGYDLRGLTEPRCPECGAPFDEQLLTVRTLQNKDSGQQDNSE